MNAPAAERAEEKTPLQVKMAGETVQREIATDVAERPQPNNTGLPDSLKSGIESLSGVSMDHVKVHYNSAQPAQLNAHAYAQGNDIHVAPGQEQHLPHEAWHVVQQAKGRVRPTMLTEGVPVNDDKTLEHEADVMGTKAMQLKPTPLAGAGPRLAPIGGPILQLAHRKYENPKAGTLGFVGRNSNFPSLTAAYKYLSKKTGFEVSQIEVLASLREDTMFSLFDTDQADYSPRDLDGELQDWKDELATLERQYEKTPDPGTGKSAKGDWASKSVRSSAKSLVDPRDALFPGGAYTIHHKVSRSRLRGLHGKMEAAGPAANPVHVALGTIGTAAGTTSTLKTLLNMPGNLEVGPQERLEDPGAGFDPNVESGTMTPRSVILNEIDTISQQGAKQIDWKLLAEKLVEVQGLHENSKPTRSVLSAPKKGQWAKGKEGKFTRGK